MGLLGQTVAYSQGIMGINIKVITQASQTCSNRAGGFKAAWSLQELICLVNFTVTFPSWETREGGTAAALPVPADERELGSCSSSW